MEKILIIAGGLFCFCGGYYKWDFFMNSYKAKPFIKLFGEDGAAKFYEVLGIVIILMTFLMC